MGHSTKIILSEWNQSIINFKQVSISKVLLQQKAKLPYKCLQRYLLELLEI